MLFMPFVALLCSGAPSPERPDTPAEPPADTASAGETDDAAPVDGQTSADPPTSAAPPDKMTGAQGGPDDTADVGVVADAEADPTLFPDPKKFSTGFFVEGSTGPLIPLGPTSRVLAPGFSLSARIGYEIRRWIAVQAHVTGSMSRYDDGVLKDELLQQYFYTGELRLAVPIRRVLIAAQGGAGVYQLSNNLLQIADIAPDNALFGLAWDAGMAVDIHSLDKHFSGGVVATYIGMPALDGTGALALQIYIRYAL